MEPHGILLSDDLIFTSRIIGAARDLGLPTTVARSLDQLGHLLDTTAPVCLIVDLHHPGLKMDVLLSQARGLPKPPFVVGYGSHVDTATLKAAREAGFDLVWPRSKFVEELATALPSWFKIRK